MGRQDVTSRPRRHLNVGWLWDSGGKALASMRRGFTHQETPLPGALLRHPCWHTVA